MANILWLVCTLTIYLRGIIKYRNCCFIHHETIENDNIEEWSEHAVPHNADWHTHTCLTAPLSRTDRKITVDQQYKSKTFLAQIEKIWLKTSVIII